MPERRVAVNGALAATLVDDFSDSGVSQSDSGAIVLALPWVYYSAATAGAVRLYFADQSSPAADENQVPIADVISEQWVARFCYPIPRAASGAPFGLYIDKAAAGNGWLRFFWTVTEPSNRGG